MEINKDKISTFDYFSINKKFWIKLSNRLISFGCDALPNNVHFTIGFDERSPDINFHITKNTSDAKNKPQIKIFVTNKKELEFNLPILTITMFNVLLQPINIGDIKTKNKYNIGFIGYEDLQNSDPRFQNEILEKIKKITSIKKKNRLKIYGNIEKHLEEISDSPTLLSELLDKVRDLPEQFEKNIDGGIIIIEDGILHVLKIYEKWFSIRPNFLPIEIANAFVGEDLARKLIWMTKRSLVTIKNAQSYSDVEDLNRPIRLFSNSNCDTNV